MTAEKKVQAFIPSLPLNYIVSSKYLYYKDVMRTEDMKKH